VDIGLTNSTTYYYVLSATNSFGASADSGQTAVTPFAAPIVLMVLPFTNGVFSFEFQGVDGRYYTVLSSSNLFDWFSVLTNQQTGGLFIYTETNATDAARFYRVQQ
jgi:hypothetical protein